MTNDVKQAEKRTYHPPQMRVINLVADQVLSGGCKTASSDVWGEFSGGGGCVVLSCSSSNGS